MSELSLILWSDVHGIQPMISSLIQGKPSRTTAEPSLFDYFRFISTRNHKLKLIFIERFWCHLLRTNFFHILFYVCVRVIRSTILLLCHIWTLCLMYLCLVLSTIHLYIFIHFLDVCLFVLFFHFFSLSLSISLSYTHTYTNTQYTHILVYQTA